VAHQCDRRTDGQTDRRIGWPLEITKYNVVRRAQKLNHCHDGSRVVTVGGSESPLTVSYNSLCPYDWICPAVKTFLRLVFFSLFLAIAY